MSTAETGFIDDGHTLRAWLDAVEDRHPRVEFTYRPAVRGDTFPHLQRMEQFNLEGTEAALKKAVQLSFDYVAARISEWNLSRPPTVENMARLEPLLFAKLYNVTLGAKPDGVTDGEPFNEVESAKNSVAA